MRDEAPYWAATLPQLPRLIHRALADDRLGEVRDLLARLTHESERRNDLTAVIAAVLLVALIVAVISLL